MRKQPQQLLASQGLFRSSIALLIFSTYAHVPNIQANVLTVAAKNLLFTGNSIFAGLGSSVVGSEDTSNKMMWQALGYDSAQHMKDIALLRYTEHAAMLAELAEKSAEIENLKTLPEGFVAPAGNKSELLKSFQQKKASSLANSGGSSQSEGLFNSLPTLSNMPNMALPPTAIDSSGGASDTIVPCKPGSNCGKLKTLSKSIADDSATTINGADFTSNSGTAEGGAVKATNSGTQSFAQKLSAGFGHRKIQNQDLAPSSSSNPIVIAPDSTNTATVGDNVISGFNVNPSAEQVTETSVFEQMPEGWFIHEDKDTGIQVRGALDKKYIETTDGKKHPDNFIQVAVKKDVPSLGLKAGQMFTFEKCSVGCYDDHYKTFAEKLSAIQRGDSKVTVSVPAFVEAMTRLKDKDERTKIIQESNNYLRSFKTALRGLGRPMSIATRESVTDHIKRFYSGDVHTRNRMAAYFRYRAKEILQN